MKISDADKKYLLSLKPEEMKSDIEVNSLLIDLFGTKTKKDENGKIIFIKPRFEPTDELVLNPGECNDNKTKVRTTVGQLMFNKYIFGGGLYKVVGYIAKTLNSGGVSEVERVLSDALLSDRITVDDMIDYLDRFQNLSMGFHHVIASSFTMEGLKPIPQVIKHRDQMLKENAKAVEEGDVVAVANMEKKLVEEAQEILKHDPSMALYRSGARGSMGNNYKNMSIMQGPIQNPITGKYEVIKTSFMEGVEKKAISIEGNAVPGGEYPKAIGSATGGYMAKQLQAAMQAVVLDEKGSDCGSKGYVITTITNGNKKENLYRYIIENGKLILLDETVIDKYIGKVVKMRDPAYCVGDKLCNKCCGDMFYKIGIKNIGLTCSKPGTTLVKMGMKKFHDKSIKVYDIDINDITI